MAFVGPSGGGKTTLASLIARFYDTTEGKGMHRRRGCEGYSFRTVDEYGVLRISGQQLLKMSIYDNVRMGKRMPPEKKSMEALKNAQCEDIIAKLPDGVDTVIGQGSYVSGGEAQRLSIARAMLKMHRS